jgi:hypothetical protein
VIAQHLLSGSSSPRLLGAWAVGGGQVARQALSLARRFHTP